MVIVFLLEHLVITWGQNLISVTWWKCETSNHFVNSNLRMVKKRSACRFSYHVTSKLSWKKFPPWTSNITFFSFEMTNPMYRSLKQPGERARLASTIWSGQSPRKCRKDSLFSITFLQGQILPWSIATVNIISTCTNFFDIL